MTGGRRGIGSALVDEVLSRGAGEGVFNCARAVLGQPRQEWSAVALEVQRREVCRRARSDCPDVDIVINNAGILLPGSLLTGAFDDITATFDINTLGPLRVTRALAPVLAARGGGALVNVPLGVVLGGRQRAYGASKAAIWSLSNSLRVELRAQGTQVLGVHVGFVDTEMVSDVALAQVRAGHGRRHRRSTRWKRSEHEVLAGRGQRRGEGPTVRARRRPRLRTLDH